MLKQRVLTALVLLSIVILTLVASSAWPFTVLVSVGVCIAAWEWARLCQLSEVASRTVGAVMGLLVVGFAAFGLHSAALPGMLWLCVVVSWLLVACFALARGAAIWIKVPAVARLLWGLWVLLMVWLGLIQAHAVGVNFLLSVLALVWAADIGAYFSGRRWGQKWFARKLAPTVSPGKSWEGAIGGAVGVGVLALVWIAVDRHWGSQWSLSLYSVLAGQGSVVLLLSCLFLVCLSVLGDLLESLAKRAAGVKDSSQILPGHGGVLDRIDAILPVVPAALGLAALVQGIA